MLCALNLIDGSTLYAYDKSAEYVKSLSKMLVCPNCKGTLIYKDCKEKTPHFAHEAYFSGCAYNDVEPDTKKHVLGKIALEDRLRRLYPCSEVYLEYKIEGLNYITDVVVIHPGKKEIWAFEVQCQELGSKKILERSKKYQEGGVYDFWLFDYDFSKYIKNSVISKYGKIAHCLFERAFRIYISDKQIEIGNEDKPELSLESLIIRKERNKYVFKDIDLIKEMQALCKKAKNEFLSHLKRTYLKSVVYTDCNFDEDNSEKADIVMVSKKDGSSCAFNIISHLVSQTDMLERAKFYKEKNIPVFWIFLTSESYNISYNAYGFISMASKYYINFSDDMWHIRCKDGYGKTFKFPLNKLVIDRETNSKEFVLRSTM
jgi:competence CoiA-like predicted nuclease